jgi:hypothetical protein
VQVVKFSPQHTSVQWTAGAAGSCAEFRARAAAGTASALVDGCAALRASIESAVTAGALVVAPPSYGGANPGSDPRVPEAHPEGDPWTRQAHPGRDPQTPEAYPGDPPAPERTDDSARR